MLIFFMDLLWVRKLPGKMDEKRVMKCSDDDDDDDDIGVFGS